VQERLLRSHGIRITKLRVEEWGSEEEYRMFKRNAQEAGVMMGVMMGLAFFTVIAPVIFIANFVEAHQASKEAKRHVGMALVEATLVEDTAAKK